MAVAVAGMAAFPLLPVAPLPQVDFPTIQVAAQLPGASPETMAATVAQPLERQFAQISGVTDMTSTSTLGSAAITLQFDLDRNVDAAAQDVQAAISAAGRQLPANLPAPPTYRKVNPADSPILVLAAHSDTMPITAVDDLADTEAAQQISQVNGVAQVVIGGEQKPAVRIQVDPAKLQAHGLAFEDVRTTVALATTNAAKGNIHGRDQSFTIAANDQLQKTEEYNDVVIAYRNGGPIRVRDLGQAVEGPQDVTIGALDKEKPAILLIVFKQPGANVIDTVARVKTMLPRIHSVIPPAMRLDLLVDRGAAVGAGRLRGDVSLRLQPRQSLADGAHDRDRLRGG
jgi:HAE1 family hydrophobic/amphiphilic exporter-1